MKNALAMTRLRLLSQLVVLLAGLLIAAPALASTEYPPTIKAQLGLMQAPDCTLCHRDDNGGARTVVRPFGRTLESRFGLTGGNVGLLRAAITADDNEHFDSDGDGVSDIDELRAGSNPNVGLSGEEAPLDFPLPETGCALAKRSPAGQASLCVFGLGLAGLGLLRRRVRSRHVWRARGARARNQALGVVLSSLLAGCSLDTRQLQVDTESAGHTSLSPGDGGAAGQGGALPAAAGAAGSLSAGGGSGTAGATGGAAGSSSPATSGCPDLDGNTIPDCMETLATNAAFESDIDGWAAELETTITWQEQNASSDLPSGSALVASTGAIAGATGSALRAASQCLGVGSNRLVTVHANAFVPGNQDADGHAEVDVYFFDAEDCAGAYSASFSTPQPLDASVDAWLMLQAGAVTGKNTQSMRVMLAISKPFRADSFQARFDNILLKTQSP